MRGLTKIQYYYLYVTLKQVAVQIFQPKLERVLQIYLLILVGYFSDAQIMGLIKEGKIRWAICGTGHIAHDFVTALSTLDTTEHQISAVGASSLTRATKFARNHKISANIFGSYQELFEFSGIDIIYVALANHMHKDAVISALNAGKHVLCEKPLGLNAREVYAMTSLAKSKNLFLMEAYWTRFFPVWQDIREIMKRSELGDVKIFSSSFGFTTLSESVLNVNYGGGHLLAIGCYLPMLALLAFNGETPTRISATGFLHKTGADDSAAIQLQFKDGGVAHLLYTGSVDLTDTPTFIIGTKGSIKIPKEFWCPTRFEFNGVQQPEKKLPQQSGAVYNFPNSAGLSYEAAAVRSCLLNGLTECPEMPLKESEVLAEINDAIREQLGLRFPQDDV